MVSTGATMRWRMRLIVSYASRQRGGAGCGVSSAVGMGFGLRGDATRRGLGRPLAGADADEPATSSAWVSVFTTVVDFAVLGAFLVVRGVTSATSSRDCDVDSLESELCRVSKESEVSVVSAVAVVETFSLLDRRTAISDLLASFGSKSVTPAWNGLGRASNDALLFMDGGSGYQVQVCQRGQRATGSPKCYMTFASTFLPLHSWCSGNIGSSHGLAPGSTPGGCTGK